MPQISKVLGATVVAVARGPDKAAALRELGADHVIDSGLSSAPLRQLVKVRFVLCTLNFQISILDNKAGSGIRWPVLSTPAAAYQGAICVLHSEMQGCHHLEGLSWLWYLWPALSTHAAACEGQYSLWAFF